MTISQVLNSYMWLVGCCTKQCTSGTSLQKVLVSGAGLHGNCSVNGMREMEEERTVGVGWEGVGEAGGRGRGGGRREGV